MKLRDKIRDRIAESNVIKGQLCAAFDRSMASIDNWLEDHDPRLTEPKALKIYRAELGITDEQILEPETVSA